MEVMTSCKARNARLARQRGFLSIGTMLFLAVLVAGGWTAWKVLPVYNTYWKVQDVFESVTRHLSGASAGDIRARLPGLLAVQYLKEGDLPREFYDHLDIQADGNRVRISSFYHVTVWLLGPVESVDPESDYDPKDLPGMDRLRDALRLDFDFEPHAETP